MNYLLAQPDRFEQVPDPYIKGTYARTCFKSTCNYIDLKDLSIIIKDKRFLFIHDNIIYFSNTIYIAG